MSFLAFCVWSVHAQAAVPVNRMEPIPAAPPSSFQQMLVHVYQENPQLAAERLSLKIADEKVSQANAGFRPNLTANLGTGWQRQRVDDAPWNKGDATAGSLVLNQPLFAGFGTVEGKRAAEMRVLAARSRLLAIQQGVLFTAIADWLNVCEKEYALALNNDNIHRLLTYEDATKQRFDAGDGTRTDMALSQSRLAQAQARYATALAERDSARAAFTRDTGLPAQGTDFPPLPPGLPQEREALIALAVNNPEMAQAEQEEYASEHDIGVAESSLWPKVYLRGSMSDERSPSLGLDRLRNDALTINMTVPLYQGGAEYSRVREAKLARQKSRQDAIDVERRVAERAAQSWDNYRASQTIIEASQRALESSTRALEGVQEEQKQGLRTVTEVLDQQSERLSAQLSHIEAQRNVRLEAYRLLASIGQLTVECLQLPVETYEPTIHHDDTVPRWFGLNEKTN